MAIEMVRIPSETPNISNTDDFVGFRYAYGNQNGYVINKGQECSYTINGSKFKINSGRLVLQGVECDINANGVEITIDNVATKRYYTVYLEVNLTIDEAIILSKFDTAGYPTIESGADLTQSTTGTARMALYNFDATSGVINNVQKIVPKIEYVGDMVVFGAKNSIANSDGTYSGFTADENGTLKTGDYIVEKKKLLFHSDTGIDISAGVQTTNEIIIGSSTEDLKNKLLEFVIKDGSKWNGTGEYRFRSKMGNDGYCSFLVDTEISAPNAMLRATWTDHVTFHVQHTAGLYTLTGWSQRRRINATDGASYIETSDKKVMDVYEIIE